jgi:hypothetical protein
MFAVKALICGVVRAEEAKGSAADKAWGNGAERKRHQQQTRARELNDIASWQYSLD